MREIVEKRNLRSKTFDLGGRKRLLRLGIKKPLHYVNEQGQLDDIDLTPTLDRGQYFISKAPYKARIGRDFPGYRYTGARGTISAELVAINGNPIARRESEYADARFYWRSISLDTDCTIIPRNARLDAIVTLHSENAPRSFSWEILGDKAMMRPVIGRDASGRPLELEQEWNDDRLTITWAGRVIDRKAARRGGAIAGPKYPVWIDPTVNEEIVAGADDASSGWNNAGASFSFFENANAHLSAGTFSTGNYRPYAGVRFQTIAIPNAATIDSAVLTLDMTGINAVTGAPSLRVYAADVDDAAAFTDPGNRIKNATRTTAFVAIAPTVPASAYTIGVTSLAQEVINRAGWASNNDMAFMFVPQVVGAGTNAMYFGAYEHGTRQEAQLDITYTVAGTIEDADASTSGASTTIAAGQSFADASGVLTGSALVEAVGSALADADADSTGSALIEAAGDATADVVGLSAGVSVPEAVGDFVLTLEADGLSDGVSVAEAVSAVTADVAALSDGLASLDAEGAGGAEIPEIRQGPLGGSGVRSEASAWRKPEKTRVRHRKPRQIEIIKVGKWPEEVGPKPERLERIDYGKIIDQRDPEDVAAAEEEEALIAILALAA